MKVQKIHIYTIIFSLFFSILPMLAQENITIEGYVRDKTNHKGLENAKIILAQRPFIGTVSNADGYFQFHLSELDFSDSETEIIISYPNYQDLKVKLPHKSIKQATFYLLPHNFQLDEVIVVGYTPEDLVETAIKKIPENYALENYKLRGFYRESIQKRRKYISVSEAIFDAYKTPYKQTFHDRDLTKMIKVRSLASHKKRDTLAVKLQGGPNLTLYGDIIKNRELFFEDNLRENYIFEMKQPIMIDNKINYVVALKPCINLPYPLFYATLYIDKESLAFTQIELRVDMADRNKVTEMILRKKPLGLRFKPIKLTFRVTYKRTGGIYTLNYLRNEIEFKCDWRRKLFSTRYKVLSEAVITDGEIYTDVWPKKKERFSSKKSLEDEIKAFGDVGYWEKYNIIEPTESLESAFKKLKKLAQ